MPRINFITGSASEAETQVFCPDCNHRLQGWEVHLLKLLACSWCGASLELGVPLELELAMMD